MEPRTASNEEAGPWAEPGSNPRSLGPKFKGFTSDLSAGVDTILPHSILVSMETVEPDAYEQDIGTHPGWAWPLGWPHVNLLCDLRFPTF